MKPPVSGPTTEDKPHAAPNMPWYLPRSAGGNRSATTANALVNRPAEPAPWTARNRISCIADCEIPHSSEPSRKITIAISRIRRRPNRSLSLPYTGTSTVDATRYAVVIHTYIDGSIASDFWIDGPAV